MRYETTIPFEGFYNSISCDTLDEALRQMFSDRDTGVQVNEDLVGYATDSMNWKSVFVDFAKDYVENFALWAGLDLEWVSLESPREYNFTTDVVVATISETSLLRAFAEVDKTVLTDMAKRRHTSYDGFSSFYDPDITNWPESVLEWDANQIGTLMCAEAEDIVGGEFDCWQQYSLGESSQGNGVYEEILHKNCPAMERLLNIHEYLETRAKREEVAA